MSIVDSTYVLRILSLYAVFIVGCLKYYCMEEITMPLFAGTECDQLVKKDQVFDYHVRHNDFESSLRFIMSRVPPLGNPAPCPAHIQELCTNIAHSVGHMSNAILDELARYVQCIAHRTRKCKVACTQC